MYSKLYALISPKDSTANIRFNQIIMPDGTADGPFGRDIQYDLAPNGIYTLIIDKSLMAEGSSETDFTIEVKLSK